MNVLVPGSFVKGLGAAAGSAVSNWAMLVPSARAVTYSPPHDGMFCVLVLATFSMTAGVSMLFWL